MVNEKRLQTIHQRLIECDPTASLDLYEECSEDIYRWLSQKWPKTQRELVEDATLEALFQYLRNPAAYNPERGRLTQYLLWSSHRDLQNIIEQEERRRPPGTLSIDRVEDGDEGRNRTLGDQLIDPMVDPAYWLDEIDPRLLTEIDSLLPNEQDRKILKLIMDGERQTSVYAHVLGIGGLPVEEQRKLVKRNKDRIQKRLRRGIDGGKYEQSQ